MLFVFFATEYEEFTQAIALFAQHDACTGACQLPLERILGVAIVEEL